MADPSLIFHAHGVRVRGGRGSCQPIRAAHNCSKSTWKRCHSRTTVSSGSSTPGGSDIMAPGATCPSYTTCPLCTDKRLMTWHSAGGSVSISEASKRTVLTADVAEEKTGLTVLPLAIRERALAGPGLPGRDSVCKAEPEESLLSHR